MVREYFTRDTLRQAMAPLATAAPSGMETEADPPASVPSQVAQDSEGSEGAAPGSDAPATVRFAGQLQMLAEMGFNDPVAW